MLLTKEDVAGFRTEDIFSGNRDMPRKKDETDKGGRPKGIPFTLNDLEFISLSLQTCQKQIADSLQEMKEAGVHQHTIPGAKFLDDHLPAVEEFCAKFKVQIGPAIRAHKMGRKTRLEYNQDRYQRSKNKPKP